MTITRKAEHPNARKVLYASLARRTHYARHVKALVGIAQVSAPLPLYRLGFEASSRPHALRNARLKGWIYLITGGESAGLVHLRVSRGEVTFAGITDGSAATILLDAATLADGRLQSLKRSFEARILEIPSLRVHALWLYCHGGGSQFVELRAMGAGAKVESLSEIETRIATTHAYCTDRALVSQGRGVARL
jgi:hypothetical protein